MRIAVKKLKCLAEISRFSGDDLRISKSESSSCCESLVYIW